jgi:hypothetical protein
MIEIFKEQPILVTLAIYAIIQITKIYLKKAKKGAFWRKYREYIPYVVILLGVCVSAVFARYFGYSDSDIMRLLQDAFYVGGGAVTADQMLKLPEKYLRDKGLLKPDEPDETNIIQ